MPLAVNSKCLAYHGPLLYEAKVLKVREPGAAMAQTKEGNEPIKLEEIPEEIQDKKLYFIHYRGWKSSWDEWKELKKAALSATSSVSATGKRTIDVSKSSHSGGINSKTSRKKDEMDMQSEDEYLKRPEINLVIPDPLKSLLVDDWEMVTKDHQLLHLPAKPTVDEILNMYRRANVKKHATSTESDIEQEFLSGLKIYFNRCRSSIKSIYGAEPFLRLLVSLPALVAQTTMEQQSIGVLKDHLEQFLQFLNDNKKELFVKHYESVSPAYESLAKA
ncbi:Chromatin modification-related protein EAF3 [Cyberlindnera fabianii]|uniref:Chromatin modification-related protein EAF3 n=1 Tax=Cyberlindnera fabianii TaxID=36022 RepID=A0A1V2LGC8_CYBFA|nr:Chromatin modification-related protein EAF3 [Cyberlindnera fabianii]